MYYFLGNSTKETFKKIHQPNGLVEGPPQSTRRYTSNELDQMGFVGVYKFDEKENDDNTIQK